MTWHINSKMDQPPKYQEIVFFLFEWYIEKPSRNFCIQKTKMSRFINDSFATCGVASFQMQKMKLTWFCREPASSRRRKISMTWQFAPLVDQISVLGGVVVPIPGVGCQKKCPATVKVGSIDDLTIRPTHRSNLGRFQKTIGGLAIISECSALTDNTQGIWKIHTTWLQ